MRLSPAAILFAWACALLTPAIASAAIVTIDGAPVTGAVVHEGHILVPFRAPMEQLGATVNWTDADQTGRAVVSGQELVRAVVGEQTAYIEGYPKVLTVSPVLIEHLEYIPVELLPEISNAHLDISADGGTATITNFDVAGVQAVGSGIASIDPQGKVLYLWVWLLPISAVVAGFGYFAAVGPLRRRVRR